MHLTKHSSTGPAIMPRWGGWSVLRSSPAVAVLTVVAVAISSVGAYRIGYLPLIGILVFTALVVLAFARPRAAYFIVLGFYPFGMVGLGLGGGAKNFSTFQLVLPVLGAIYLASMVAARVKLRLTKIELLILCLAGWQFLVEVAQSDLDPLLLASAIKGLLWMLAWFPIRLVLRGSADSQLIADILVIQLIVFSAFSLQELFTGWNYFAWSQDYPSYADVAQDRFGVLRLPGFFGHGVLTGMHVSMLIPFAFVCKRRFLSIVGLSLAVPVLYFSQGRSSLFGLAAATGVIFVVLRLRRGMSGRVLGWALVAVCAAFVFREPVSWLTGIFTSSFDTSTTIGYNWTRTDAWSNNLAVMFNTPFFGLGLRNLAQTPFMESPMLFYKWAFGGPLLGLLSEGFLVGGSVYLLLKVLSPRRRPSGFQMAAFVGFASQAIALHANWQTFSMPLSAILLVAAAMDNIDPATEGAILVTNQRGSETMRPGDGSVAGNQGRPP